MNGGHKTVFNSEIVVDDLCKRSKAVGGAGSVGNDGHIAGIGLVVDAHYEHGGVLGGSGDDNFAGAGFKVSLAVLYAFENAGGFDYVLYAVLTPGNLLGIFEAVDDDFVTVDNEFSVSCGEFAVELAVGGVVLRHICHIFRVDERVVDCDDFKFFGLCRGGAENKSSDSAKAVDSDFNHF